MSGEDWTPLGGVDTALEGDLSELGLFRLEINLGLLTGLRVLVSSPRALRLCC